MVIVNTQVCIVLTKETYRRGKRLANLLASSAAPPFAGFSISHDSAKESRETETTDIKRVF